MESFGDLTAPCEGDPEEIGNCHTFDCEPFGKLFRAVKYSMWLTSIVCLKYHFKVSVISVTLVHMVGSTSCNGRYWCFISCHYKSV